MLEASLTSLESKLDAMLAAIENPEASTKEEPKKDPKEESKS